MSSTWYTCKLCTRCFPEAKGLISHKKKDHPVAYRESKKKRKEEKDKPKVPSQKLKSSEKSSFDLKQLDGNGASSKSIRRRSNSDDREGSVVSEVSSCCTTLTGESLPSTTTTDSKSNNNVNSINSATSQPGPAAADTTHTCKYCRDWYPDKLLLSEHIMLVHGIDQTFKCLYCKKNYTNRGSRDKHEIKEHSVQMQKENEKNESQETGPQGVKQGEAARRNLYECKICGNKYVDHLRYTTHKKRHVLVRKAKDAEMIKKKQKKKQNGNSYMDHHRPNKSDILKKCFVPAKLERGMDYPYECDECYQRFQLEQELRRHVIRSGHISPTNKKIEGLDPPEKKMKVESSSAKKIGVILPTIKVKQNSPRKSSAFVRPNLSTANRSKKSLNSPPTKKADAGGRLISQMFQGSQVWVCGVCMIVNRDHQDALDHVRSHPITTTSSASSSSSSSAHKVQSTSSSHKVQQQGQSQHKKSSLMAKSLTSASSTSKLKQKLKRIEHNRRSLAQQNRQSQAPQANSSKFLTTKVEDGKTWYVCNFCQKELPNPSAALQHLVVHTGERKFKCPCGIAFLYSSHLHTHQRNHNH